MAAYKTYIFVWVSLLVLTVVTVLVSYVNLGLWNAGAALTIASVKAGLVAYYFMHLRHETKLVVAFAIFPLLVLALILFGTLIDVYTR
ncbi:cytochrome C oxidase subunit IV family protein [Geomonas sp. RF6]|uniref:cytochrome C oxidase subunit IV family protein n=1 Tax=Geomonas sp. RF6 TaxID=2897342 RepID=UPI001E46BE25|nr:cytochrome C oxidase subunit IV family protein [Geomonas sp. RF6]UFS69530.1 cytochrome C oxidase subunit IV family protein [Geomonas sp. RF6]